MNEIKKELYKQNPIAHFVSIRKSVAVYECALTLNDDTETLWFNIPVSDMGDAYFTPHMSAKLLIRWLIIGE